ncbi:MAG: hypothetical protein KDD84_07455 [Caldilineaceae bacterium]|nr:hypothetical protein [Caldilineaceae bacterium]
MKRAVSISLGSSRRNHASETVLCGEPIRLERIGADGDRHAMRRMFLELDGQVDAFGFGGADLGLEVNAVYYPLYSVHNIVDGVKTPVVDGGGIRTLVERRMAQRMEPLLPPIRPKRALFCVGVARYHMARSFLDAGYEVMFGDLAFGLGVPVFIRNLSALHILARILLPIMGRVPFEWLYPTGEAQDKIVPKYEKAYNWASVICDDFHYIKRNLPARLDGKTIVTNTTTAEDIELLRARNVAHLVTVTPRLEGRSFGTNVIEAALTAIAGKGRALTQMEMSSMLGPDDLKPEVLHL